MPVGRRAYLTLLLCAQLVGCAQYHAVRPDLAEQVDEWIEQERYGLAIASIERMPAMHSDHERLTARLPAIREKARRYERQSLERAAAFEKDGRWYQAGLTLRAAREAIPESEKVLKAETAFLKRREARISELRFDQLLAHGRWLRKELALQEQVLAIDPEGREAEEALERRRREAAAVASELLACGKDSLAREADGRALECLRLSIELAPDPRAESALAEAQRRVTERRARSRAVLEQRRVKERALKAESLRASYRSAFDGGDLLAARETLLELRELYPESVEIKRLEKELELEIASTVQRGMEASQKLYSRGQIREALDSWTALLLLDPENRAIKANIERAQRVLEKLDELDKRQHGGATAGG